MRALALLCVLYSISVAAQEPQKHFGYFKVAKGQIGELCPQLKAGQRLTYTVKSNKPIKFNFHYHKGEEVNYPIEDHETQLIAKTFTPRMDETYCLMWTGLKDYTTVEVEYFIQNTKHANFR